MTERITSHIRTDSEGIDENLWDMNVGNEDEDMWSPTYLYNSNPLYSSSNPILVDMSANASGSRNPFPPLRPPRNPDRLLQSRTAFNRDKENSLSNSTATIADINVSRPRTAPGFNQSDFKSRHSQLLFSDGGVLTRLKEVREHIGASAVGSVAEIKNYAAKFTSKKQQEPEETYRSSESELHTGHDSRTISFPSLSTVRPTSTERSVLATPLSNTQKSEDVLERRLSNVVEEQTRKGFMKTLKSLQPLFHTNHARTSSTATVSGSGVNPIIDISQPILIISSPKSGTSEESSYEDDYHIISEEQTERDPYYSPPMLSSVSLTSLNGTDARRSNISPQSMRDSLPTNSLPIKSWMQDIKPLRYRKKDHSETAKGLSFVDELDDDSMMSEDSKSHPNSMSFGNRFKNNFNTGYFRNGKGLNPFDILSIEAFSRRNVDSSGTDELSSFLPL